MQVYYVLYSHRWTPARGWHWKYERECEEDTAQDWLEVFKEDEPNITFRLSRKAKK